MLLTGDPIDAARAAAVGLVNRVVDEGQALAEAVELATAIAANGPLALAATKQIATRGGDWSAAERWDEAAALSGPVFSSQDAQEGARAFAEKRSPVWKGQ
jgi:enoyl-CoA hydratase